MSEALHEEEALGKAYDMRLLARLWTFVRPYRVQVLCTVLLVIPAFLLWQPRQKYGDMRERGGLGVWWSELLRKPLCYF